jgi:hypothetical protein
VLPKTKARCSPTMSRLRSVSLGLLFALLTWLMPVPAEASATFDLAETVPTSAYDAPSYDQPSNDTAAERGPPRARVPSSVSPGQRAFERGSHGAEAYSLTAATHTYTSRGPSGAPARVEACSTLTGGGSRAIYGAPCCVHRSPVAANGVDIAGARFAQTMVREGFQKGGLFEGRTISDVVGDLGSGALTPKDVPINVVVRDGNTLILNTRSATALTRAGVPRSSWSVINRTGDDFFEGLLNGQLRRNGLDSSG